MSPPHTHFTSSNSLGFDLLEWTLCLPNWSQSLSSEIHPVCDLQSTGSRFAFRPFRCMEFDLVWSVSSFSSQQSIDQSLTEMRKSFKWLMLFLFLAPLHTSGYYIRYDWCKSESKGFGGRKKKVFHQSEVNILKQLTWFAFRGWLFLFFSITRARKVNRETL